MATVLEEHRRRDPSAFWKWGGAALLASSAIGLYSYFRTKYKLDGKINRKIGGHLRQALSELREHPHLHDQVDCNDVVRDWTSRINAAKPLDGLDEEIMRASGRQSRQ